MGVNSQLCLHFFCHLFVLVQQKSSVDSSQVHDSFSFVPSFRGDPEFPLFEVHKAQHTEKP